MWMTDYIRAVKCGLRDQHGFIPIKGTRIDPIFGNIPDGEYPMTLEGRLDHVRIADGCIDCCNFDKGSQL